MLNNIQRRTYTDIEKRGICGSSLRSLPIFRKKDIHQTVPRALKNEEDFSLSIVIPILHRLGFSDIRYNHGKREFGKDIVFSRKTEFDYFEFWGAQVKCGDVYGKANSEIDEIIAQIDDAFKVPLYDLYTKQRERISKLLIVISGRFTENAIEKICEKIENNALRNNLIFIDGEKIGALGSRLRS